MSELYKVLTTGVNESESTVKSWSYSGSIVGKDENNTSSYASATLTASFAAISYMKFDFDFSLVPSDLIIDSVALKMRCKSSHASVTTISSRTVRMRDENEEDYAASNTDAFGTSETIVTVTATNISRTQLDTMGVWITASVGILYRNKYVYVYGGSVTIEGHYATGSKVRIKVNGEWKTPSKVLYKTDRVWTDVTSNAEQYLYDETTGEGYNYTLKE